MSQYAVFRETVDVAAWRARHRPISYPGRYHGRYLIDLFLENEHKGYIDWLVQNDPRENANAITGKYYPYSADFVTFVDEAKELLAAERAATPYNLRKRTAK